MKQLLHARAFGFIQVACLPEPDPWLIAPFKVRPIVSFRVDTGAWGGRRLSESIPVFPLGNASR